MINVLIPTKPDDMHAIFVKLALNKNGHQADLWYTADFPSQQTHSFEITNDKVVWNAKGIHCELNNHYDVVWYRRPSKPILPNLLHPHDIENAKKENMMFFRTFWQVILPNAVWINPVNTLAKVNSKLFQLKIAASVGMNIPKTLVSNDPNKIKAYIQKNAGNIVYKTLYPMVWLNKDEVSLTYTNPISISDLPSDAILQSTPGIFQEKINKKYELRITYFGNHYIAVKIDSQKQTKAMMDWRYIPTKQLDLEQVMLPDKIAQHCQDLMKKLGIVFGCFDFIVTPDDEYYFLEVNEQGQFLWIEEVNPDIKMLQTFTEFLISSGSGESQSILPISLLEFEDEVMKIQKTTMKLHKNPLTV